MISIDCLSHKFTDIQAIIFDKDGTLEDSGDYLRNLAQKRARLIDAQIPGVGEPLLMAFGVTDRGLDPAGLQAVGSRYENEIAAAAYIAETGRGWSAALEIVKGAFEEVDRVMESTPAARYRLCCHYQPSRQIRQLSPATAAFSGAARFRSPVCQTRSALVSICLSRTRRQARAHPDGGR
jgi:phosphoglycolate phosphatase-like HAD superfamily hydrolase